MVKRRSLMLLTTKVILLRVEQMYEHDSAVWIIRSIRAVSRIYTELRPRHYLKGKCSFRQYV